MKNLKSFLISTWSIVFIAIILGAFTSIPSQNENSEPTLSQELRDVIVDHKIARVKVISRPPSAYSNDTYTHEGRATQNFELTKHLIKLSGRECYLLQNIKGMYVNGHTLELYIY